MAEEAVEAKNQGVNKSLKEIVVDTKNLEKIYDGKVHAVRGVNFELFDGEVLGFLGPNGAGKTTTISILLGIIQKTKGDFSIYGKGINDFKTIRELIGYTPQELVFYNFLTVQENAELFADCYQIQNKKARINELFDLFQLTELKKRRAEKLSGGQKRRLNLVLGMLHSPKILFLDEPSAGMDPQSRHILWENIERLSKKEGISIMLTTHLMEVADRLCDRILIIDYGKIIAQGTPDELKATYGAEELIELIMDESLDSKINDSFITDLRKEFSKITFHDNKIKIFTKNGASLIPDV
ncbi:MAG: ABC transporter ATP-binding protein, partial [Candidatus Heimdallarchaeota archaeon]|nr:ABC transporter ATP-binding protein [Candidatus Heimdallarchaeota archaeon]MCK4253871.1 ABC transporter ATP-binding protein [Candidatus Heimdallarchaeota archaeon]